MLAAGLTAGCMDDDNTGCGPDSGAEGAASVSYVSLSLAANGPAKAPTRANPTGGENGDGTEAGQDYENAIRTAAVFFYQGTNGVNSAAGTPVTLLEFQTVNNGRATAKTMLRNGTYNVIAVANPGNLDWARNEGNGLTLGDVRDHLQKPAWTATGNDCSDFVMASADGGETIVLNSNPQNNPATVTVDVERMAARLDYDADGDLECTDPAYTGSTVTITGAALVNNLTAGSYLLKRVATDADGNPTYLGKETPGAGVQTNYVIDPWTAEKNGGTNVTVDGTQSPVESLYGTWFPNRSDDPNWWADYVKEGATVTANGETWRRIGYTMENTTSADRSGKDYSTGVVFKARFQPAPNSVAGYTDGETFFSWGGRLYATAEAMMSACYGNKFNDDFGSLLTPAATTPTTWEEVKQFAATTLTDNDPTGYQAYLTGLADGKADDENVPRGTPLAWKDYMTDVCGYGKSAGGKVLLDQNGVASTRVVLYTRTDGLTRTYENATCYYVWWVRHSNDGNDSENGVMEYAVVRNNIYKLKVNSVYSLGGDVPGDEQPAVTIYVKNWQLLNDETVDM